jgi:hypothetical protein
MSDDVPAREAHGPRRPGEAHGPRRPGKGRRFHRDEAPPEGLTDDDLDRGREEGWPLDDDDPHEPRFSR